MPYTGPLHAARCKAQSDRNSVRTQSKTLSVVIVAPAPVIALLVFVQTRVLAVGLMPTGPVGAIDHDFVVVPVVIIVMFLVVVSHPRSATCAAERNEHGGRENEQSGATSGHAHTEKSSFFDFPTDLHF